MPLIVADGSLFQFVDSAEQKHLALNGTRIPFLATVLILSKSLTRPLLLASRKLAHHCSIRRRCSRCLVTLLSVRSVSRLCENSCLQYLGTISGLMCKNIHHDGCIQDNFCSRAVWWFGAFKTWLWVLSGELSGAKAVTPASYIALAA